MASTLTIPQPVVLEQRPWPRFLSAYVIVHSISWLLYALLGKGFAYAGFPPLYAGEVLLAFGLVALLISERLGALVRTPLGGLMVLFLIWQSLCAIPHLETYGIDTLRDSVVWAYAAFAWIAAALVLRLPGFLRKIVAQFRRFSLCFLFLGPVAWLATIYLGGQLPHWPNTSVSVPLVKGGEFCVHLAGILAFISSGAYNAPQWWLFLVLGEVLLGMSVRGGVLAFVVSSIFVLFLRPRLDRLVIVFCSGLLLLLAWAAFDIRLTAPGVQRELSFGQLSDNLVSMVSDSGRSELEGTKAWRLAWWGKIWEYTVDGPYYWMGKGYGINLADSDGFQVGTRDEPLRSPHSSHITFLARSGVPGALLWVMLQISWAALILKSFIKARSIQASQWTGLFIWLLAYWMAFMVAAGFDVFLEGPMAGIPFWTVFGLGWGSVTLFQSRMRTWRPQAS